MNKDNPETVGTKNLSSCYFAISDEILCSSESSNFIFLELTEEEKNTQIHIMEKNKWCAKLSHWEMI